jgi:hypothetical protein
MLLYDYKVYFNKLELQESKAISLIETKSILINTSFRLELSNNQNRKVLVTSNKPFLDNQSEQIINFFVENVVTFSVERGGNVIYYKLYSKGTEELAKYWLSHTFLPILFTIENVYYFLHAGAVKIFGYAILFVADSYGGKSTITDFFIRKGHTMISDDKVAIYGDKSEVFAVASYPYHRPYRKFEDLGIFVENFAKDNTKMKFIFNLVRVNEDEKVKIEEVIGIEKFRILKFSTEIELNLNCKARFEMLSKIANNIKLYNITIPWKVDRLEEVYEKIINFTKEELNI